MVWNLWTRALWTIYTKPGLLTTIIKPLGQRNQSASIAHTWFTTYNPLNNAIIIIHPNQEAICYLPQNITCQHFYYKTPTLSIDQNPTSYPITISSQWQGFRTDKQILPIPTLTQSPSPAISDMLQGKIQQTLPQYAPELWNHQTSTPPATHKIGTICKSNQRSNLLG